MPERKHAGAPDAVLARPLSLASYPVATGRPRPGHQRPRARKGEKRLTRGPEINKSKSRRPEPVEQHRAAETIFRRASFFGTHAPRDKENQPEMPERKHAGAPDAVLARPLSLASYPVATGRPRPGHQRPRALRLERYCSRPQSSPLQILTSCGSTHGRGYSILLPLSFFLPVSTSIINLKA